MAKRPNVPCSRGCGRLLWPDSRCPPAEERVCGACRRTQVPPVAWSVQRRGAVVTVVLEECPHCGARPEVTATFPSRDAAPRALSWIHQPTCPSNDAERVP